MRSASVVIQEFVNECPTISEKITSAAAVHMNGLATVLCVARDILESRSGLGTLEDFPRRIRRRVISPKKRSTWLSQLALVGVKCK